MGYWVDDPTGTSPPRYVEGFDPAQGQSVEGPGVHTPWWKVALDQSKYYAAPFGAAGLDALAGPVLSAAVPSLSVPGGVGSTLLPGSLATSTAVPLSTIGITGAAPVAAPLVNAVTNAGKVAGPIAKGTAAAGVGKTILDRVLGAGGNILKDIGGGLADRNNQERANQAYDDQTNAEYNRLKLLDTVNQNNAIGLDINQRDFQNRDYQKNFSNAMRGDLLANMEDFKVAAPPGIPMGNITGGLSVDAMPHRREVGNTVQQQAMERILHPQTLPPIPGPTDLTPPLPGQSGRRDTSGAVAAGLSFAGGLINDLFPNGIGNGAPNTNSSANNTAEPTANTPTSSAQTYRPGAGWLQSQARYRLPDPLRP